MKLLEKKTKFATITLILLMTLSAMITFTPDVKAQVYDTPTFLFVTASPDPVGIGQQVYVGITFSKPTPTGAGYSGDLYEGITLDVTDPSGHKSTYGPYYASPVAGVIYSFTPDMVGNYTMQAHYPGQVLKGYNRDNPTISSSSRNLIGSKMLPSDSNTKTLIVQQDPVKAKYETPPLPTEYWVRPISGLNWWWGESIAGNDFGLGGQGAYEASGNVYPSGTAPNSPHIVWTKAAQWGGQPGYPIGSDSSTSYSSVSLIQSYFHPVCILNGVLYYNRYDGSTASNVLGWRAVDIRTGEVIWDLPAGKSGVETIAWGQIVNYNNYQEFGSNAYLYSAPSAGGAFSTGANWMGIYDARTGNFLMNVTNTISTSKLIDYKANNFYDTEGSIVGYYTSGGVLRMYNYTQLITSGAFIRTTGTVNGSNSNTIVWNATLPTTFNGASISLSISAVTPEVILVRQVPGSVSYQGVTLGYQYVAGYNARTGALMWGPINQTLPAYEDTSVLCARDGYYIMHDKDTNRAWGYSLTTGQLLWGPTQLKGGGDSAVWRDGEIAYGKVYIWDLGGYVTAIDLETGKIAWTYYNGDAGYDTPFESYPIFGYNRHTIADGKLFLSEGIMYTPPLHPSYRIAINCTDGTLVWKILAYSSTTNGPVGDGYLISFDSFDNQIYSFGKGPTTTTVTASPKISVHGSSVLVEGTVMDISAGTTQDIIAKRFAKGLPAVSEGSMESWMEYAYQQQIKPTNATGVDVVITVLDPNNNVYDIGRTTSDASGSYKLMFTPEVPGQYTVIAQFAGSESYYGSSAETAIGVDPAAATPVPTATSVSNFATANDLMIGIAAIIIVIVIIGIVLAILMLRKRP